MDILGVDPGTKNLGYGYIQFSKGSVVQVESGIIQSKQSNFNYRIFEVGNSFLDLIQDLKPSIVVVEKIFYGKNIDSAFKLGHIRGFCIISSLKFGEIFEYTAREVKKGITGSGSACKSVVKSFICKQLKLNPLKVTDDESDALALAYYHFMFFNKSQLYAKRLKL